MRHIKTINHNGIIIAIDSGVNHSNATRKSEVFKHLTVAFISKHMTTTIDRIVYQDVTRNFKRVANLSVKIETIAYERFNMATGKTERVEPQLYYRRFTTLEALVDYTYNYVGILDAKMGL